MKLLSAVKIPANFARAVKVTCGAPRQMLLLEATHDEESGPKGLMEPMVQEADGAGELTVLLRHCPTSLGS